MFKSFVVATEQGGREKKDLGTLVDEKVNGFISEVKGELENFQVQADVRPGGTGTAFVTVFYKENGKKKKD